MFKNLKLSTKLIGGFLFIVILIILIGYINWNGIRQLDIHIDDFANTQIPGYSSILKLEWALTEIKASERSLLISNLPQERINNQFRYIDEAWKVIDEALKTYNGIDMVEKEKELWTRFNNLLEVWKKDHEKFVDLMRQYVESNALELFNQARDFNLEVEADKYHSLSDILDQLVALNVELVTQSERDAQKSADLTVTLSLSIIIAGSIIALIIGLVISVSTTKSINTIVNGINESANQVAAASNQLSASSQQLAEGSAEQSTSLEETSSTLEESTSMIQQNTENTKQAALLADQAKESVEKGNREMEEMTESMNEIKKSSDQISKVIKVIDDIAFQTNILALNAAVEAARAGEAGMGFAVVAEEVRNLAQRSAQAAKDTAAMIENNIELSEKGVNVTQRVREALSEVTAQTKKISELMAEIAASSQEQSQGISQINSAIAQMETVVQQNAANAEESASASEELSAQARNLKEMVQQLVILVHGKIDQKYESSLGDGQTHNISKETHQDYQSIGTKNQAPYRQTPVSQLPDKRTKLVSPEDVIPLDKDNKF